MKNLGPQNWLAVAHNHKPLAFQLDYQHPPHLDLHCTKNDGLDLKASKGHSLGYFEDPGRGDYQHPEVVICFLDEVGDSQPGHGLFRFQEHRSPKQSHVWVSIWTLWVVVGFPVIRHSPCATPARCSTGCWGPSHPASADIGASTTRSYQQINLGYKCPEKPNQLRIGLAFLGPAIHNIVCMYTHAYVCVRIYLPIDLFRFGISVVTQEPTVKKTRLPEEMRLDQNEDITGQKP